jgi:hypothetical protein
MDDADRVAAIKFEIRNAIAGMSHRTFLRAGDNNAELLVTEIYDALERSGWLRDRAAPPPAC